jgi:hypothetical protein
MSTTVKFQQDTVEHVLRAFKSKNGSRRFLVADEVGLGKTIVAQQVIERMSMEKSGPLNIVYISSNLAIAKQNAPKLLGFLPPDQLANSMAQVDRLSLNLTKAPPRSKKIRLYTMTPGTSVPALKRRTSTGTIRERILIMQMLFLLSEPNRRETESVWNDLDRLRTSLLRNSGLTWNSAWKGACGLKWFKTRKNPFKGKRVGGDTFRHVFGEVKSSLQRQLGKGGFRRAVTKYGVCLKDVFGATSIRKLCETELRTIDEPSSLHITQMRTAMALLGLRSINPDLIIFDEFQKFKDLLYSRFEEDSSRKSTVPLVKALRGETGKKTALLLLSATPYRMYESSREEREGGGHYEDFFNLVEFLYGGDNPRRAKRKKDQLTELFKKRSQYLRKSETDGGEIANKDQIEALLRQVMCRTERATFASGSAAATTPIHGTVTADDSRMFGLFKESVRENRRGGLPAFWDSIPYPLQTMGKGYVATKTLDIRPRVPTNQKFVKPVFVSGKRRQKVTHPKIRALMFTPPDGQSLGLADPTRLVKPWMAPSLPWWKLSGAWQDETAHPEKMLIFSRFCAVPSSVSGLLSFHTEREALKYHSTIKTDNVPSFQPIRDLYSDIDRNGGLNKAGEYRMGGLLPRPTVLGVLGVNPLIGLPPRAQGSLNRTRRLVGKQLMKYFEQCNVEIVNKKRLRPPTGLHRRLSLALRIRAFDYRFACLNICGERLDSDFVIYWQSCLKTLDDEKFAGEISIPIEFRESEFEQLIDYLLGGMGNIVGRSLLRSGCAYKSVDEERFREKWEQLVRSSMDVTSAMSSFAYANRTLTGQSKKKSWQRLIQLCIDGNLESVLDEHFWVYGKLNGLSPPGDSRFEKLVKHLGELFDVRDGGAKFRECNPGNKKMGVRTNVARAYSDVEVSEQFNKRKGKRRGATAKHGKKTARERLMSRFNSPFWPHVLTTTSVGQEGLDFHYWCNSLVHWDVRTNPIDMEQREGRIQRFGGLGVRRAIAGTHGTEMWTHLDPNSSPWDQLGELASDGNYGDSSNMQPWWTFNGSKASTYHFDLPFTQQNKRFERVRKLQSLYRLALGQTNQEALVDELSSDDDMTEDRIKELMIDLSPQA